MTPVSGNVATLMISQDMIYATGFHLMDHNWTTPWQQPLANQRLVVLTHQRQASMMSMSRLTGGIWLSCRGSDKNVQNIQTSVTWAARAWLGTNRGRQGLVICQGRVGSTLDIRTQVNMTIYLLLVIWIGPNITLGCYSDSLGWLVLQSQHIVKSFN